MTSIGEERAPEHLDPARHGDIIRKLFSNLRGKISATAKRAFTAVAGPCISTFDA
jgi:regulator of sirC expression with transglutaminase-like and TPR domain